MNYDEIFQSACEYNLAPVVKHLLENGYTDMNGIEDHALITAAYNGHKDVIEVLNKFAKQTA